MAIVGVTLAHAEGELIMSRLFSFSAQEPRRALEGPFLKNSEETVWETDPCTGTSGDHYEGMLFCCNCLHPGSTLNSMLPFRKSCDWVRFLATSFGHRFNKNLILKV